MPSPGPADSPALFGFVLLMATHVLEKNLFQSVNVPLSVGDIIIPVAQAFVTK